MRGQKIVDPKELVYRLVQIRQGIDIALGADRIYTQLQFVTNLWLSS